MLNKESNWFESWFNQDYLELYCNRNALEAETQVQFLLRLDELKFFSENLSLLDVACGAGRHLVPLSMVTKKAFGLDLSKTLLNAANKSLTNRLVLGDMRQLPIASASLSLVTSFFSSFGYFSSADDELRVLKEFSRVLLPNGLVFFDLANKQQVINSLVEQETVSYSRGTAEITRKIKTIGAQTRVQKQITLKKSAGEIVSHKEDLHLFDSREFYAILEAGGFVPVKTFGSFLGEQYLANSGRLIVLAKQDCK